MNENGVRNFEVNGFAGPISVLSRDDADAALLQATECATINKNSSIGNDNTGGLLQGNKRFKVHLFLSEMNRIAHHPAVLQSVREALQTPHIALWSSDINVKKPHSQEYFSAHQDATYTGLYPGNQCLTVWVALSDPVGMEEGCMSFLRGSHKAGQLPHVEGHGIGDGQDNTDANDEKGSNLLSRGQRVQLNASMNGTKLDDWVTIPLRAGEFTMHQFHTIHKSGYNHHPTQPRVGLALRYMAACVRQTGPVRESITWIDDDDDDDDDDNETTRSANEEQRKELELYFDLEPVLPVNPSEEDLEIGREAHSEAMRREATNYFHDSAAVKAYDEKR